jgi:hypothetical protein
MVAAMENDLGLDLGPLFIAAAAKGALSGPHSFAKNFGIWYLK